MSIDYGTYVGPYVRCAVAQEPKTVMQITCPNVNCPQHTEGSRVKFCPLCGSQVATVPRTEMDDAVDHWDVSEHIEERLATAGGDVYWEWSREHHTHLWKPNTGGVGRHLDAHEPFLLDEISTEVPAREIAAFQAHFATDLAYFREVYGADAVTLHWGIIQDYM